MEVVFPENVSIDFSTLTFTTKRCVCECELNNYTLILAKLASFTPICWLGLFGGGKNICPFMTIMTIEFPIS